MPDGEGRRLRAPTIHWVWRAFNLQPHRTEISELSADPVFVEKVRDIVGLDLSPPERAVVLCVDEKSQIQALDRSQRLLPMARTKCERRTHDFTCHGTLTLFAALDAATGAVIGRCYPHHRGREFLRLLREIERNVPPELDVHLLTDNYATHKTPAIQKWLGSRRRWQVHFTPTASSWADQVERFFANITEKQIRRGVHRSTAELKAPIRTYLDAVSADPNPFCLTNSPTTSPPPSSDSASRRSKSPQDAIVIPSISSGVERCLPGQAEAPPAWRSWSHSTIL